MADINPKTVSSLFVLQFAQKLIRTDLLAPFTPCDCFQKNSLELRIYCETNLMIVGNQSNVGAFGELPFVDDLSVNDFA